MHTDGQTDRHRQTDRQTDRQKTHTHTYVCTYVHMYMHTCICFLSSLHQLPITTYKIYKTVTPYLFSYRYILQWPIQMYFVMVWVLKNMSSKNIF